MTFFSVILLLVLLAVCSFGPGFFVVRRLRLGTDEKLCALLRVPRADLPGGAGDLPAESQLALVLACHRLLHGDDGALLRDLRRFLLRRQVRRRFAAFGLLLSFGILLLMLIRHYSGGTWSNDWLEHYERARFLSGGPTKPNW